MGVKNKSLSKLTIQKFINQQYLSFFELYINSFTYTCLNLTGHADLDGGQCLY
jgi:hypothetical protein